MKKLLMLLVLVPLMTLANTEVVDGITWTYWHYIHYSADADPKLETEILGANPSTGSITIPSTLGGCPVTGIGDSAFGGCTGLTSVTIPSSVTSIGVRAFGLCELLRTIHIGKNGDIDKVKQMLVNSGFDVAGVTFTVDWEKDDEPQTIVAETETHVDVAKGEVAPFETVATGTLDPVKSKITANTSGLKLSYKEKDGTFKGSFKVYNLENGTKIKSYTANVTGVLIDSTGYGTATIKKVGTVSVEIAEL